MYLKKHEQVTDNPPIRIYINLIESRITFKIKTRCYHELLTPETMKALKTLKALLGSTNSRTNKHKNGENVPHLEIT